VTLPRAHDLSGEMTNLWGYWRGLVQQICHLDRSVAQWRDLRFYLPVLWTLISCQASGDRVVPKFCQYAVAGYSRMYPVRADVGSDVARDGRVEIH
jgi:hypothetical protein